MKGSVISEGTQYLSDQKTPFKNDDIQRSPKVDNGIISDDSNQKQLFVPKMEVSNARIIDFNQQDSTKDKYIDFLEKSLD